MIRDRREKGKLIFGVQKLVVFDNHRWTRGRTPAS